MSSRLESTSSAAEVRTAARAGKLRHSTAGLAADCVQSNVVVLPRALAFEFLLFCQRNPQPCPVVEVVEAGRTEAATTAPGSDVRTDVPRYHVYEHGNVIDKPYDLTAFWREDLVTFLLGCSYTFELLLVRNGVELPHFGSDKSVAMFKTRLATRAAGPFAGPMVVSMRWIPEEKIDWVVQTTSTMPLAHGAPVHVGDPSIIGVGDLNAPDFGDAWPPTRASDVPVFWACGVTPQAVAMASKVELMITHAPGHMFVTDLRHEELLPEQTVSQSG